MPFVIELSRRRNVHLDQKRHLTLRNQQLEEELEDIQTNSEVGDEKLKKAAADLRKVSDEYAAERNRAQQLAVTYRRSSV